MWHPGSQRATLEVPKDFMRAVCQHRHVFALDEPMEVAAFAGRIRDSKTKNGLLHLPLTISSFCTCALSVHADEVHLRWCHWFHEREHQMVQHSVPIVEEQLLIL